MHLSVLRHPRLAESISIHPVDRPDPSASASKRFASMRLAKSISIHPMDRLDPSANASPASTSLARVFTNPSRSIRWIVLIHPQVLALLALREHAASQIHLDPSDGLS